MAEERETVTPRLCPNCKYQIETLRIERKVNEYFEINVDEPIWDEDGAERVEEDMWEAICWSVRIDGKVGYGNGCMNALSIYPEDDAEDFMNERIDGEGHDLETVTEVYTVRKE